VLVAPAKRRRNLRRDVRTLSGRQSAYGSGNEKTLALVTSTSPVAWRHVHLGGRYAFRDVGRAIDLDAVIERLMLE